MIYAENLGFYLKGQQRSTSKHYYSGTMLRWSFRRIIPWSFDIWHDTEWLQCLNMSCVTPSYKKKTKKTWYYHGNGNTVLFSFTVHSYIDALQRVYLKLGAEVIIIVTTANPIILLMLHGCKKKKNTSGDETDPQFHNSVWQCMALPIQSKWAHPDNAKR